MTSSHLIDAEQLLADQLAQASPDLLRGLLSTFIAALMGAEADALCGAGYRERSDERSNQRNGYRHRDFDTRAATIDVAIPKLRQGSYFPDWLLQRRKRAERALTSVVATCYLLGVSTRRMERLVETLGVTKLSKSQVSIMAKELDEAVEAFRTRPLDAGPYTFLAADALVLKVREAGRVVGVHTLIDQQKSIEGNDAMTSSHLIDAEQLLADQLAQASPDLLRGLLSTFIAALMGAEADALCGAGYRERSDERSNQRNGYRHRDFDTRAATIDVAIPKLRQGSYFPDWLLQRRKRAERALTSVVATCYLLGVSTEESYVQGCGVRAGKAGGRVVAQ
ncbi:transposase [Mycobacterium tuberculosis KT-0008]|nr:transposase [Mycobacterium tuberculosis KT-0008]